MVIATMLLAGTAGLFVSNKRIYKEQDESAILQENGRFAIGMLYENLRMAGFVGCNNDPLQIFNQVAPVGQSSHIGKVFNGYAGGAAAYDRGHTLEGFEKGVTTNWAPSGSNDRAGAIRNGTDAVTVRYFRDMGVALEQPMRNPNDDIDLPDKDKIDLAERNIGPGSKVAISNCVRGDVFEINTIGSPTNTITPNARLGAAYSQKARFSEVYSRRFYIGDHEGEPTLFCAGGDGLCQGNVPLVEGVEDMQILYEIAAGDGDERESITYRAGDSFDWDRVTGVKVAILVRTPTTDPNYRNTNPYYLLDKNIPAANDTYRRRVFTTYALIRNRAL